MDLNADLVNAVLRLQVLPGPGPVAEARVETVDGRRFLVKCACALNVGAAVQLEAPDRMLLGEVLSFERGADGARALLDVQHSFLYAGAARIRSHRSAHRTADSWTDPAGA
jgi:hypothetical protein